MKKSHLLSLPVLLALVFILCSCTVSDPKDPRFVVAKGGGVDYTRGELNDAQRLLFVPQKIDPATLPKDRLEMLEYQLTRQNIVKKLLVKQAKGLNTSEINKKAEQKMNEIKANFPDQEKMKAEMEKRGLSEERLKQEIRDGLVIQEVLDKQVPLPPPPTPAEIEKFYADNEARFVRPAPLVRASHILVMVPAGASAADKAGKLKAIEGARTRVLKGEDFAAVAREVSEDQYSAPKGGDLDFFQKGQMVPEFEKVAFSSKVGAVSNVFESKFGYHFLKVTDTKPAGKVPLEEIKEKISQFLQNKSREKAIRDFIEKLEQQAQIKYNIPIPATPVASNAPAAASTSNAAPAPAPAGAK